MSTITREFTKEQLQQIIETDHVQCGEASALARIALASLEAEPVAWLLSGGGAKNNVSFDSGNAYADPLREVTPLYTAPPAPVALTSGYSDFEEIWSSSTHPLTQDDEMKDFAWDIWNACRAAMLQGAEPVSQPDAIDANLVEALRFVQCMLEDYRERNYGDAEKWIRHIDTHMSDYTESHGEDAYSILHDLLPAAPQQEADNG